jgi:ABC-2 type transport system ATP-binding protein
VAPGEIYGFLGPNGAGKSTTVLMLTTLLPPTAGTATVAGYDVVTQGPDVRRSIGAALQEAALDPFLTGRDHMRLQTAMHGFPKAERRKRGDELLERVGLIEAADRKVGGYSGGMKRRLDLALALVHSPPILFLDEPTTGLDPQNRANLWEQLRLLREAGTTIFLTTHNLDEADHLCDRVAIVDHGRVIALGSPDGLKQRYSADTIAVAAEASPSVLEAVARELEDDPAISSLDVEHGTIRLTATDATRAMAAVFGALASKGIPTRAASVARPTLDDVFLRETGRSLRDGGSPAVAAGAGVAEVAA